MKEYKVLVSLPQIVTVEAKNEEDAKEKIIKNNNFSPIIPITFQFIKDCDEIYQEEN